MKNLLKNGFYLLTSFIISTLFLNCFWWSTSWLLENPFDWLGWLRAYPTMIHLILNPTLRIEVLCAGLLFCIVSFIHGFLTYAFYKGFEK